MTGLRAAAAGEKSASASAVVARSRRRVEGNVRVRADMPAIAVGTASRETKAERCRRFESAAFSE
jgi:hypothetical protein